MMAAVSGSAATVVAHGPLSFAVTAATARMITERAPTSSTSLRREAERARPGEAGGSRLSATFPPLMAPPTTMTPSTQAACATLLNGAPAANTSRPGISATKAPLAALGHDHDQLAAEYEGSESLPRTVMR